MEKRPTKELAINRRYALEFALFTLAGIPSYLWCSMYHFCMCGHLAHRDDPTAAGMYDLIYMGCFVAAALAAYRSNLKRGPLCSFFFFTILYSRMMLGNWHTGLILLEVPILCFLGVYALKAIVVSTQRSSEAANCSTMKEPQPGLRV